MSKTFKPEADYEALDSAGQSFHRLTSQIATRLLKAPGEDIDRAINTSLEEICAFYWLDGAEMRWFDEGYTAAECTHHWERDPVSCHEPAVTKEGLPWLAPRLFRGELTAVTKAEDLPPNAKLDAAHMAARRITSILVIPLSMEGRLRGTLAAYTCGEQRQWDDETTAQLRFLGGSLSFAFARAEADAAVEASEAHYRSVVGDQTDFIVRWTPGGIRTWVNDRYCEYFGHSREEVIGTSFFALIADEDRERIVNEMEALTPESPARTGEHRVKTPDGKIAWHEWTDRAVFDTEGQLVELQSIGRDVTQQRLALAALAESEERYRSLVDNSTDWVWQLDMNRRHVYSNHRLEAILGYSTQELGEMSLDKIIHPDDLVRVNERLRPLIAEKRGWHGWVTRFRHKNGSYRYMNSSASPVIDANGELGGFRGIDRDVTLQVLLTEISADLVTADPGSIDRNIEQALERIARSYALDSASLWWLTKGGSSFRRSHEWAREGMQGNKQTVLAYQMMPWASDMLRNGKVVKFESLDELLPEHEIDWTFFEWWPVKSLLLIPLVIDDHLVGAGAFSTLVETRTWPSDTEIAITLLAEVLGNAHARSEATHIISRSQRDLARSEKLAHVGSYSYVPDKQTPSHRFMGDTVFSEECLALFGLTAEEASFDMLDARVHEDDRDRVTSALKELMTNGSSLDQEYRVVRPDGTTVHVKERTEVDRGSDGKFLKMYGSVQDVTDRVQREQKLRDAVSEIGQLKERLEQENVQLREEVRAAHGFNEIVGDSQALRNCLDQVSKVAPTDIPVMILGETGTGKELIARAIHDLSPRKDKAMVSVNCAALAPNLVASELFGHEEGAFTGAHKMRRGRFELADGGTLFLDEVGDLAQELQSKILRILQEGEFERLGGTKTLHVDVRLITATNVDIREAVDDGRFRSDLYYRINTFPVHVPTLSERPDDIPLLAEYFVRKHGPRTGKNVEAISAHLLEYLGKRSWPGNVRELEGFILRTLIANTGPILTLAGPEEIREEAAPEPAAVPDSGLKTLREAERDHIVDMLDRTGWVIEGQKGAARLIGVAPSTLRSKMKQLGIERSAGAKTNPRSPGNQRTR